MIGDLGHGRSTVLMEEAEKTMVAADPRGHAAECVAIAIEMSIQTISFTHSAR